MFFYANPLGIPMLPEKYFSSSGSYAGVRNNRSSLQIHYNLIQSQEKNI
jgi:hypothetical protein